MFRRRKWDFLNLFLLFVMSTPILLNSSKKGERRLMYVQGILTPHATEMLLFALWGTADAECGTKLEMTARF